MRLRLILFIAIMATSVGVLTSSASACGGFFCANLPVDQVGERIVFSANADDTITSLIEIQYVGEADDFSWILPIPEAIGADALAVPEDGDLVFEELHRQTDVQFIAPALPDCADDLRFATAEAEEAMEEGVEIFGSGEVGPFGFDIIGSESPEALLSWLSDNNYTVTPEMEPLIDVYVEDQFAFIAMRLLDGEDSESISPIEITYPGSAPMIPLRLTAVAAQPNMPIWVWIFGEDRAVPANFADMAIATEEITFSAFGGNDYTSLVQARANALDGQAFITEFAQPTNGLGFDHAWLQDRAGEHSYLTRMNTYIDPDEMTVDPIFEFDGSLPDVSNVRDASGLEGLYNCERNDEGFLGGLFGGGSDAIDPTDGTSRVVAFTPDSDQVEEEPPTDDPVQPIDEAETTTAPIESDSGGVSTALLVVLVGGALVLGAGGATVLARRS